MYNSLNYGNTNIGDEKMNKKVLIWSVIIAVFAIIAGFITYKIISKNEEKAELNANTQKMVEISEESANISSNANLNTSEDAVTDECLDEWDDYNEYMSQRVEEASNNFSEKDTHYLLKDVYGYIEVYYLDENNDEFLYKKTDISTEYLSSEDIDDLQVGIEVVGIEALNKMLEDFE